MSSPLQLSDEPLSSPVPEGEIVAGKYVVGRVLASGGMGVVAEGRHVSLDQRVAIKFLLPEIVQHHEAVERFLREAKSTAKIDSDHVVRVFDVGSHGDVPFLVMEYLDGVDLGDLMHRTGQMSVADVVDIAVQALEGLARAHSLGIVHRDLKPSNLFLAASTTRRGAPRVKVLDFGISKVMPAFAESDPALTSTKSLLGSPGYMSPEQVRSTKNVDERTDVWSMGVILYEMLSGRPAFVGETIGDIFAKIREEPLPLLRSVRPDVPPSLEVIIMRCLERDRALRFDDATALLDAIGASIPGEASVGESRASSAKSFGASARKTAMSESETLLAISDEPRAPARANTQASWVSNETRGPRKRFAVGAAAILVSAALVVGAWFWWRAGVAAPSAGEGPSLVGRSAGAGEAASAPGAAAPNSPIAPNLTVTEDSHTALPHASVSAAPVPVAPPKPGHPLGNIPAGGALKPAPPQPTNLNPSAPSAPSKRKDDLGI